MRRKLSDCLYLVVVTADGKRVRPHPDPTQPLQQQDQPHTAFVPLAPGGESLPEAWSLQVRSAQTKTEQKSSPNMRSRLLCMKWCFIKIIKSKNKLLIYLLKTGTNSVHSSPFWSDRKLCWGPGQTSSTAPRTECERWSGGDWRGGRWRPPQLVPAGEESTVAGLLLLLLLLAVVPYLDTHTDNSVLIIIFNNIYEESSWQIKCDRFIFRFFLKPKYRKTWKSKIKIVICDIQQTLWFKCYIYIQKLWLNALKCIWRYYTNGCSPHWLLHTV